MPGMGLDSGDRAINNMDDLCIHLLYILVMNMENKKISTQIIKHIIR